MQGTLRQPEFFGDFKYHRCIYCRIASSHSLLFIIIHNNTFVYYFISFRHLSSIARNALILGSCTFSKMVFCRSISDLSITLLNLSAYLIHTQFAHPDMQQFVGSAKSSIEVSFAWST